MINACYILYKDLFNSFYMFILMKGWVKGPNVSSFAHNRVCIYSQW